MAVMEVNIIVIVFGTSMAVMEVNIVRRVPGTNILHQVQNWWIETEVITEGFL